jgi:enoyl-CoA hydratase/carnithine racemase
MDLMRLEREGDVFVLHLTHEDNRFNPASDAQWHEALDEVEASDGPAALVTTGTGKFYSNGLDLERLTAGGGAPLREYVPTLLALFARMMRLPVVTVAAINGHAFAAGAMMTLTHDFRVMRRDRGYWCLPEADLGMPLSPGMNDLIAARLAPQVAHEAIVTAKRYPADEAEAAAIVDEAAGEDQVLERAVGLAATQAGKHRGAIVALRTRLYADLIASLEAGELP